MIEPTEKSIYIKIYFEGATYNLGSNVQNFNNLIKTTSERFKINQQLIQFSYEEKSLSQQQFEKLIQIETQKGSKSLKINLEKGEKKLNQITMKQEKKSKKFSFNQKQFQENQDKDVPNIITVNSEIKFSVRAEINQIKAIQHEKYYWTCTLVNQNSNSQIPKNYLIKDLTKLAFVQMDGFNSNGSKQLAFGPYTQSQVGKYTHLYQVFCVGQQGLKQIGSKFGFVCNVQKKIQSKQINNDMFSKIDKLRKEMKLLKSTENLIMRLKELGIGEKQIDLYDKNALFDILESIRIME